MTRWQRALGRPADERGFTLIELAMAIGVFGVLLMSMSLLFSSSFDTANEARFRERGKTLAQEKLEEIRSLPFFVSQKTNVADVDVLDRYFPGTTNGTTPTGAQGTYDGTTGVWMYSSVETINEPDGSQYTRRVDVQFVVTSGGTATPVAPIAGYDSDVADADEPASGAVKVAVTVSWIHRGRDKSVSIDTIITRSGREELKVEASGSVAGVQVSGLTFQDGDVGGVAADILAIMGEASVSFREVTGSSAQGAADAVEVVERDPVTNVPLQPEGPTEGESTSTAPNGTTGTAQTDSDSMAVGSISSVNTPVSVIASWGAASPAAATEARVSSAHTQNPESRATVAATDFLLNARDLGALAPHAALEVESVSGDVEQTSTTSQSKVTATVTLTDVTIWAAPQLGPPPGTYKGTVRIKSLTVLAESLASSTTALTTVDWTVTELTIWDPDTQKYVGPWTFGFISSCGGWVGDPALCGPDRTDGLAPSANPNPIVIPDAYSGTDASGNPALSLSIVVGATLRDSFADAAAGVSNASAAQKNVLSITLRDDVTDAEPLEPMVVGLGDANTTVSYVSHQH